MGGQQTGSKSGKATNEHDKRVLKVVWSNTEGEKSDGIFPAVLLPVALSSGVLRVKKALFSGPAHLLVPQRLHPCLHGVADAEEGGSGSETQFAAGFLVERFALKGGAKQDGRAGVEIGKGEATTDE